jgi:hypothetical protein
VSKARRGKAGIRKRDHSRLQVSSEIASGFAAVLSLQPPSKKDQVKGRLLFEARFPGRRCSCGLHLID